MKRTIIMMLDSFGVGASADAASFGDVGSDTFGHIAKACAEGKADIGREGPLKLPNLARLGLGHAAMESTGAFAPGFGDNVELIGAYGHAQELSSGKDTPSGHWEMAGVPVLFEWGYFSEHQNSFPKELTDKILARAGLDGFLGNCHASGTTILEELGEEHMRSGKPIFYTSADSVFQIACHEETFGLDNLYRLCEITREELEPYNIGRVIARPFDGTGPSDFARTGNRKDYSLAPPAKTVLDKLKEAGGEVVSVGKIADIYAYCGITKKVKANGLEALFDATLAEVKSAGDNTIVFTNFVDFDSHYGHRRDVAGYAKGLEYFDARLPEMLALLGEDDLLILTADHGCDPTWQGTDHTREYVPVLAFGAGLKAGSLGRRKSFADIGQSIASHFKLEPMAYGESFL
ncbi:phosphopentomutase [Shewanella sp. M16]|uniref:phosphopentomutase n=1 Tax=Shewanella TaxID=22 RepID=UPI001BAE62B9|nr:MULTISPECIES: phosphopentomutase [unclassified Shewanella]GCF89350.1 phosphopentomutase [Shewanella sp. M-Br]MBS0040768.1 phosphopentomutase [Shewanella sp. M16]MCU7963600.1 phosphopentomutase [Shewanella sp. SW32]MCU7971515.1 phosphopentomutase [Shewanella sp. SW29]MCU8090049.1 phosphopentomutase [Shewanella sp. SM20]